MFKMELTGLQKYIEKTDDIRYYQGAVYMIEAAKEFATNTMPKHRWLALKELIADTPTITTDMDMVNKAYKYFLKMAKEGKVSLQEQQIVDKQVDDCNNMIISAYAELKLEGKVEKGNQNKRYKKVYSIKTPSNENNNDLILK